MDDRSKMMKMEYRSQQPIAHILTPDEASSLMRYLEIHLQDEGCNHSHRFTQAWLDKHIGFMQHEAVLTELENMGGYCDCEVLKNCYEDYLL